MFYQFTIINIFQKWNIIKSVKPSLKALLLIIIQYVKFDDL